MTRKLAHKPTSLSMDYYIIFPDRFPTATNKKIKSGMVFLCQTWNKFARYSWSSSLLIWIPDVIFLTNTCHQKISKCVWIKIASSLNMWSGFENCLQWEFIPGTQLESFEIKNQWRTVLRTCPIFLCKSVCGLFWLNYSIFFFPGNWIQYPSMLPSSVACKYWWSTDEDR